LRGLVSGRGVREGEQDRVWIDGGSVYEGSARAGPVLREDTVRRRLRKPERRSNNWCMARRAAVRRMERQRRYRKGRRRTLLSTTVHARTGSNRSERRIARSTPPGRL